MWQRLYEYFAQAGYMPHGHCYLWKPGLIWLHFVSDFLIALSYFAIPVILFYFIRRRKDIPFSWMFMLFGIFIVACGTTHVLSIVTLWIPAYWLAGTIKLVTAVASVGTAILLIPLIPKIMALPNLEAERLKTQFFANMSHEFRTPITLILSPLESLLAGEYGAVPTSQQGALQIIHNNAVRLMQMANGILDLTKLEEGKMKPHLEPVEVVRLTRSLMSDFSVPVAQKKLTLDFNTATDSQIVLIDRYFFERILFNLLSNAIKFTPQNGRITVSLKYENEVLQLIVSDTGIGIDARDRESLFQRFEQVEGSSTRRFEGSGLGLTLVKEFAGLLGGSVRLQSEKGQGSAFIVEVKAPQTTPDAKEDEAVASSKSSLVQKFVLPTNVHHFAKTSNLPSGSYKILIAEDNVELASYISHLLCDFGDCQTADNGASAFEKAKDWVPDIVISDVMMPKRDGFDLCRDIKSHPKTSHIPVILLTALIHRDALLKGWEAGADEYLFKPFHPKELVVRVKSILKSVEERQRADEILRKSREELEQRVHERTAELAQTNRQLLRANQVKSEFMTMVTHELRTPLGAIKEGVSLLLDGVEGPVNADQQQTLGITKNSVDRLARLVDNVLDFEKLESGSAVFHFERAHLNSLVEEDLAFMHLKAEKKRIRLDWKEPPMDVWAECDIDKIHQVLNNLIDNAIKFTDEGGRVSVSLKQEQGQAVITVEDTGIGLSLEDQDKIFNLFTQIPHNGLWKTGGFGVGLAISKKIIIAHHGQITVTSQPDQGSCFKICWPLTRPESA